MTSRPPFLARWHETARRHPDRPALVAPGLTLTHAQLTAQVQQRAAQLAALGHGPGSLLPIELPRSIQFVVEVLATWTLGAAFAPLDPDWPEERRVALRRELQGQRGDGLAYVIYTSGSTGRPKGVRVGHEGLVPVLDAQIRAFGLSADKRALWMLSPGFDASLSDLGTAFLSGAALCLAPPRLSPAALLALLRDQRITHADLPPALLPLLDTFPSCMEVVVIGGEVCPPAVVRRHARKVRVLNVYGPTEATICTSLVACDPATWERPLLGAPLPHVRYHVLDDQERPAQRGELYIGGPALALGYIDQPALEAQKFPTVRGQRLYRTGDLVRLDPDGELVFVGRVDRQRKLRGQLVAPEEVEAALREHPAVVDAAVRVAVRPRPGRSPRETLVAHLVRRDETPLAAVRAAMESRLPRALVPWLIPVRELPRGATGKVDLEALESTARATPATSPAEPVTPDDEAAMLARLFAEILALPCAAAGLDDDFFALGGDSHAALELLADAGARGLRLSPDALYRAPTPRALAASLPSPARSIDELRRLAPSFDLPSPPTPRPSVRSRSFLLTGAAGFFGSHLLAALLADGAPRVHVVVRADDDRQALERVRRAQAALGHELPEGRVRVWRGDVSRPAFGLGAGPWEELCAQTSVLVHGAARLHLLAPLEELLGDNVGSVREALRWQRASGGAVHLISTLSVLLATPGGGDVIDEQVEPDGATRLQGGYAQSKWLAEEVLRRGGGGAVYRLGLLTGDQATGRPAPSCQLAHLLRGLAALGAVPAGDHESLRVDLTPVDHAARATARLLHEYPENPDIHQLASARGVSLARLVGAVRAAGVRCDEVSAEEFEARWREAPRTEALAATWLALGRLLGATRLDTDLFLLTGRTLDGSRTEARAGLAHPELDEGLLQRYVAGALAPGGES